MKRLILFSLSCALVLGGAAVSLAQGVTPPSNPPTGRISQRAQAPVPPSTPKGSQPAPTPTPTPTPTQLPPPPAMPSASVPAQNTSAAPENDMPVFQNAEGYHYDPAGRRDPFKPYGESQIVQQPEAPKGQAEPAPTPTEPLQAFDVSQFKLLGIIWQVKDPKAMVADPSGRTHLIRKQTKIGRNSGFVAAIREGEVIVVEPSVGENGTQTAVTRILNLK